MGESMKKSNVVDTSGSGKWRLARRLAAWMDNPAIGTDELCWLEGW